MLCKEPECGAKLHADNKQGLCRSHRKQSTPHDRDLYLQRTYGLSLLQRDTLLAAQGGLCAVCDCEVEFRLARSGQKRIAHVDHDHKTGGVRGILCDRCNLQLGHYEAALAWAPRYLEGR